MQKFCKEFKLKTSENSLKNRLSLDKNITSNHHISTIKFNTKEHHSSARQPLTNIFTLSHLKYPNPSPNWSSKLI